MWFLFFCSPIQTGSVPVALILLTFTDTANAIVSILLMKIDKWWIYSYSSICNQILSLYYCNQTLTLKSFIEFCFCCCIYLVRRCYWLCLQNFSKPLESLCIRPCCFCCMGCRYFLQSEKRFRDSCL